MRRPPRFVIHINFLPHVLMFEPRRVWTALRRAEESGKVPPGALVGIGRRLGQTSIYLAGRDYILRTAVRQLKAALETLSNLIDDRWMPAGPCRVVNAPEAVQARDAVLLAVDSFLFEFRAYLELLARFVYGVLTSIGNPPPALHSLPGRERLRVTDKNGRLRTHDFLRYLCAQLSVSEGWYSFLAEHRNFFTHRAAPYIAVEDRGIRPPEYDFLIMRVNIADFTKADPADYFRLSECAAIVDGVRRLAYKTQQFLVEALEK